jgi:protein SCO1/2
MIARHRLGLLVAFTSLVLVGCKGGALDTPKPSGTREYDLTGKVVAVAPDRQSVSLDHEEIPGLMMAMKMEYRVADPKLLDDLKPGDTVKGRLKDESGKYTITRLEKLPPGPAK